MRSYIDRLDEILHILERNGGVARYHRLRGCSRCALDRAVRDGTIRRDATGVYSLPGAPPGLRAAVRFGGAQSHLIAAMAYGWSVVTKPSRLAVTVPLEAKIDPVARRALHLTRADLSETERLAHITSPLRTVFDCARALPRGEALAVADSALRTRMVSRQDLLTEASGTRGPGASHVRVIAALADGRAANAFESAARSLCYDIRGLHVVPQFPVDVDGEACRVDLADPQRRIVIECDSFEWHGHKKALLRDARRYNALTADRWRVLRLTWEDVIYFPNVVRSTIQQVLEGQSHRRGLAS